MNSGYSGTGSVRNQFSLLVPAIRAALIQLLSFLGVLALAFGASWLNIELTIAAAVLLQGGAAALLSRCFGLARWWQLIQLLFPGVVVATLSLQLPPVIFLVAFVALLGLYWNTFRTQVPFYPSGPAVWKAVADLLPEKRSVQCVDIGSGLGGLICHLSDRRPDGVFTGVESAPLPWLVSVLRSRLRKTSARFMRSDYRRLNFAAYDVIFAYLSPAAMPALWEKAQREMQSGALLLSYEFEIPEMTPHFTVTPDDSGRVLYGWYF